MSVRENGQNIKQAVKRLVMRGASLSLITAIMSAGLVTGSPSEAKAANLSRAVGEGIGTVISLPFKAIGGVIRAGGNYDLAAPANWKQFSIDGFLVSVSPEGIVLFETQKVNGEIGGTGLFVDTKTNLALTRHGVFRIEGENKELFKSFAEKTDVWVKYLDTQLCSDETDLTGAVRKSLLGGEENTDKCKKTFDKTTETAGRINNALIKTADGGNLRHIGLIPFGGEAERSRVVAEIIESKVNLEKISNMGTGKQSHVIDYANILFSLRGGDLNKTIEDRLKDMPPENEIVSLKEGKTGEFLDDWTWWVGGEGKSILSNEFAVWAGWQIFTSDIMAKQLAAVDYNLRNLDEANSNRYAEESVTRQSFIGRDKRAATFQNFPRWKTEYYAAHEEDYLQSLIDDRGFWILPGIDQKKLFINWVKFLPLLSPDELRELLLSAGSSPYRESEIDDSSISYGLSLGMDWPLNRPKKFPHNGALIALQMLALVPRSEPTLVNVPSKWEGIFSPGMTLKRYLWLAMANNGEDQNSASWRIIKSVHSGDYAAAKEVLKEMSKELERVKGIAPQRAASASLLFKNKRAVIEALKSHPSKQYQEMFRLIAPEEAAAQIQIAEQKNNPSAVKNSAPQPVKEPAKPRRRL